MKTNKGINQVIPIRVTFGGAIHAFDFRKVLNDKGEIVVYRVFDRELPAELRKEVLEAIGKVGEWAAANNKFADINELRGTVKIFEAREKMTDELAKKAETLVKKNKEEAER